MRCSRPGVPGMAHGRASVFGSRLYGLKVVRVGRDVRDSMSRQLARCREPTTAQRRCPGSRRKEDDRRQYLIAMRQASMRLVKQSPGGRRSDDGTGRLAVAAEHALQQVAPARSWSGCRCWGPARCTSMITSGSSTITASPMRFALERDAGADGAGQPSAPPNEAPMAEPMAAISSSAWNVLTPKCLKLDSWCRMSLAGVIG